MGIVTQDGNLGHTGNRINRLDVGTETEMSMSRPSGDDQQQEAPQTVGTCVIRNTDLPVH